MDTPRSCPTCAGDTTTIEPCPDCDQVPADRATGYAVTVWVEGAASQSDAERVVGALLIGTRPDGVTADVVPE